MYHELAHFLDKHCDIPRGTLSKIIRSAQCASNARDTGDMSKSALVVVVYAVLIQNCVTHGQLDFDELGHEGYVSHLSS
jgi:hypothetical protein